MCKSANFSYICYIFFYYSLFFSLFSKMEYYQITEIGNIKMEPEVMIPDYEPVPEIIQIDSDDDDMVEIKDPQYFQYIDNNQINIPPLQAITPTNDNGYWINGQYYNNVMIEQRDVYQCSCGEEYIGMDNLLLHQENSHLKCVVCKKYFLSDKFLKIHVKNDHPNVSILFDCLVCNKSFGTENALKQHSLLHKEVFNCKYCESGFSSVGLLKTHESSEHSAQISQNINKFSTFNEAFASFAKSKDCLLGASRLTGYNRCTNTKKKS